MYEHRRSIHSSSLFSLLGKPRHALCRKVNKNTPSAVIEYRILYAPFACAGEQYLAFLTFSTPCTRIAAHQAYTRRHLRASPRIRRILDAIYAHQTYSRRHLRASPRIRRILDASLGIAAMCSIRFASCKAYKTALPCVPCPLPRMQRNIAALQER